MITAYQACLNHLTKMTKFLEKKTMIIPGPLVKAPKVTQDQYDMEKYERHEDGEDGWTKDAAASG